MSATLDVLTMAPPPGLEHGGNFMLHRIQNAPNVDIEGPAILFFGDLIEWSRDFDAGVVKRDIEAAMSGQDEVDSLHYVGVLGDVCANKRRRASGLGHLRGDVCTFLFATAGDDDFRAASAKASAVALADTRGASDNKHYLLT